MDWKNKKQMLIPFLVAISSVAVALWISGMQISGTIEATSGTQPDLVSFVENVALNDSNYTFNKTFFNENGEVEMTFSCDLSNIVSTDANCVYEEGKDIEISVYATAWNGYAFNDCSVNPTVDLVAGNNELMFMISPHANRCGLNGSYTIDGVIA